MTRTPTSAWRRELVREFVLRKALTAEQVAEIVNPHLQTELPPWYAVQRVRQAGFPIVVVGKVPGAWGNYKRKLYGVKTEKENHGIRLQSRS